MGQAGNNSTVMAVLPTRRPPHPTICEEKQVFIEKKMKKGNFSSGRGEKVPGGALGGHLAIWEEKQVFVAKG